MKHWTGKARLGLVAVVLAAACVPAASLLAQAPAAGAPVDTARIAKGRELFTSWGCTGCHSLADADSHGDVGPHLDGGNLTEAFIVSRVTNGQGADKVLITVGILKSEHVAQAVDAAGKGGRVVVTGLGDLTEVGIPITPSMLALFTKEIRGALFGDQNPSSDILKMLRLYQEGKLKLDELITNRYKLDDVNQGYEDMHAGKNIRGVIIYD